MSRWTNDDFDAMSWHDNRVHGFRLIEGKHGSGELELDLDYILEWKERRVVHAGPVQRQ